MAVSRRVCLSCECIFEGKRDQPCPECGSDKVMPMLGWPSKEQPESVLIIQFAAPGSALFNMQPQGIVTPEQLAVIGEFLLTRAREMWRMQLEEAMAQAQEEQEPKIAVPSMHPAQVADILKGMKE